VGWDPCTDPTGMAALDMATPPVVGLWRLLKLSFEILVEAITISYVLLYVYQKNWHQDLFVSMRHTLFIIPSNHD
jgi:hypothetical protein